MSQDATSSPVYSSLAVDPDLSELVNEFVNAIPDRISALLEAFEKDDPVALGTKAHQLKGALGSYGFSDLSPIAARLEHSVRQGEQEENIKLAMDELISQCRRMTADPPQ